MVLEKNIEQDAKIIGTHRFLNLKYEDFCRDPRATIQTIQTFYKNESGEIDLGIRKTVPEFFPFSCRQKVYGNDYKRLKKCLEGLYD